MKSPLPFFASLTLLACSTASTFVLDLPDVPHLNGGLLVQPINRPAARCLYVTGRGPSTELAFSEADARALEVSIRDTVLENGIFARSMVQGPETPAPASSDSVLNLAIKNHVLAADLGGIMEVEWTHTMGSNKTVGRFSVHCGFGVGNRIKNCLNRAVAYRIIREMSAALREAPKPQFTEYEGATYYEKVVEAAAHLPSTLTATECIFWTNSQYGPQCAQQRAYTMKDINWKLYIDEGPKPQPPTGGK